MAEEKQKKSRKTMKKEKFTPFDKENIIRPLKVFISIVPYGQGDAIMKLFEKCGATFSYVTNGEGTGKTYLPGLLSVADVKKQIVFSLIREDKVEEVCEMLRLRFSTSKAAQGISLSIKLTSVAGVSVYRFLTNVRKVKKVSENDEIE